MVGPPAAAGAETQTTGPSARQYEWVAPDYEYVPLRLPPGTDRLSAAVELTVRAEFGEWELDRVRLYSDGTRKVTLRRPRSPQTPPGLPL